jgi:hypothetical protein
MAMKKLLIFAAAGFIALAVGVSATEYARKSDAGHAAKSTMPSFEEFHSKAHLENLPVQEVKEPY